MRKDQVEAFLHLSAAMPRKLVPEWGIMCRAWENDQSSTNPFESPKSSTNYSSCIEYPVLIRNPEITLAEVRRQLAEEEKAVLNEGVAVPRPLKQDVSPATMIYLGIEIEEVQYVDI